MMTGPQRRFLTAAVSLVITACAALAQNDVLLTHYFEAPSLCNPAATGLSDMVRARVGSRLQWVGVENAPKTFLGVADTPFKIGRQRFGGGMDIVQESFGLYSTLGAGIQISYKLKLLGGTLSLGLRPGVLSAKFRGSDVFIPDDDDYHEDTDEAIPRSDMSGTAFDLSAGVWYTRRAFWAGISATHLNSPVVRFSADNTAGTEESVRDYEFGPERTLYLIAGGNIAVKNTLFEVLPSAMLMTDFTFTRVLATARIRYRKFLSAGLGYRQDDAVSLILGVEFRGFSLSYSYDWSTSAIARASNGSHEIFAGYSVKLDLGEKNKHKQKSIRLM